MLQYIIALISILVFIYLIVNKPTIETYVLFVFYNLPFINTKILPLEYGFVKTFDVVTVVALLIFLKEFLTFNKKVNTWLYTTLVILFWAVTLMSKISSEFPTTNLYLLYPVFNIFIFGRFLFLYLRNNDKLFTKVLPALKTSLFFILGFMTLQIVFGLNFTFYKELGQNTFSESTGLIRYPGMFSESQYNGQFLALGSFVFLIATKYKDQYSNYLNYFGFALSILAIILAGSRSALGGFAFGCIFLVSISSVRVKIYTTLSLLFGAFVFFLYKPDSGIFGRAENLGDDLSFRQSIWTETFGIIKEYPIFGIGFGNFESYLMKYHQELYLQIESGGDLIYFTQPENGYLKILVEQGYIVFIIFILLLLIPFLRNVYLALLSKLPGYKGFMMAALISWIVAFNTVYSFLDYRLLLMVAIFTIVLIIPPTQHTIFTKPKQKFELP